jgi:hypothetical protein
MNNLVIISIDIGLRNLGICKEIYPLSQIKEIKPPTEFYNDYGSALPDMVRYITEIGKKGRLDYWERKDLGDKKCYYAQQSFINLIDWLDALCNKGFFNEVQIILIEQQMKTNNIALSIMYHIHSYLLIKFKRFKTVMLYPSKNKTRVLGASLKIEKDGKSVKATKYNRKKWSIECITGLLTSRNDQYSLEALKKEKKKDDLCDTVAQCLSYVVLELLKEKKIKCTFSTLRGINKKEKQSKRLLELNKEETSVIQEEVEIKKRSTKREKNEVKVKKIVEIKEPKKRTKKSDQKENQKE